MHDTANLLEVLPDVGGVALAHGVLNALLGSGQYKSILVFSQCLCVSSVRLSG